jgi:Obg family GTPase CgtA-like protein
MGHAGGGEGALHNVAQTGFGDGLELAGEDAVRLQLFGRGANALGGEQDQRGMAEGWSVEKTDKVFVVTGEKIEKFARRTDMGNIHSLNRLRDIMRKTGIVHELIRQGADGTSLVRVGEREFTLTEEISA